MALKLNSDAVRHAVKDGDVDAVREYLESGVEANLANPNTGRTLLHIACRQQGHTDVVRLLLQCGADKD
ncbi:unnamed protein product, partial [Ectocarpus sp. 12 AP-2014]